MKFNRSLRIFKLPAIRSEATERPEDARRCLKQNCIIGQNHKMSGIVGKGVGRNRHFATLSSDQQTVLWTFAARSMRQQVWEGPTEWEGADGEHSLTGITKHPAIE